MPISIDDAFDAVLAEVAPLAPLSHHLDLAPGLILAENVQADLDLPPFDKALVDGYALRASDDDAHHRRLRVIEEVAAGQVPRLPLGRGEATLVMTGAPLPQGADAVVMHETTRREGDYVRLEGTPTVAGRNRLERGREMRAGEVVLPAGSTLSPPALGVLASVGRTDVLAIPRPRVAVVPTGDELVDPSEAPGPGQIRNSNATMLVALANRAGARVVAYPIARDESGPLRHALGMGIREADVLLVTGGVSAGNRDLVPAVLETLGVRRVFHKIRLKPGKPLWFGVGPSDRARDGRGTLVFGLPGNPVSGLVGFLLFVRPALEILQGHARPRGPQGTDRPLARAFTHLGDRPTYHPARLEVGVDGVERVAPLDWAGSADLRTVALAHGFAHFPEGERSYRPGDVVGFLPLD